MLVPLPRGNITASPAGAAEGTADPRSDAPETDPWVPEPLRPPGPLPRIPSGRGGTDASSPRGIGGQDWHRVWRARGARERLERSIIGRAKNVTLGKGGRRAAGKHVSLNPLPVCSPESPRHGVRLQQHTRPRADDTHTRARTHSHAPPRVARCRLLPDFPAPNSAPLGRGHGLQSPSTGTTPPAQLHTHTCRPYAAPGGCREPLSEAPAAPRNCLPSPLPDHSKSPTSLAKANLPATKPGRRWRRSLGYKRISENRY